jgi:hypothetical protein
LILFLRLKRDEYLVQPEGREAGLLSLFSPFTPLYALFSPFHPSDHLIIIACTKLKKRIGLFKNKVKIKTSLTNINFAIPLVLITSTNKPHLPNPPPFGFWKEYRR